MNKEKCFICENRYYYLNYNGEWITCPICDIKELAKRFKGE